MPVILRRAPIEYRELRRPYNIVRFIGSMTFGILVIAWVSTSGDSASLVIIVPALAVAIDSLYRLRNVSATGFVSLMIDATAISIALAFYGPSVGVHGVAILTLLVSGLLMLTLRQALVVIAYLTAMSIAGIGLQQVDAPFVSITATDEFHVPLDIAIVAVFIGVTAGVLLLAVQVILRTQDRMTEALAQERRAVQLRDEFVSMVSHELRTPLTGIAGFTETLSDTWSSLPSQEVDEFLAIMGHETEHLANLVEDILVIPRLEAGKLRLDPEQLDLSAEAHAVAGVALPQAGYSMSIPSGVQVVADKTRLRQIMRNLLENARKYGGDQVLIEGTLSGPGMYAVSVSDNGVGISVDDRERIFQHFEQLSTGDARLQQGVGLGLPIARKLARAMGGDLWYEDRFPVGAKFVFTVPMADAAERRDAGLQTVDARSGHE